MGNRVNRVEQSLPPGAHDEATVAVSHTGDVTQSGVFGAVLDGYDAVYGALPLGRHSAGCGGPTPTGTTFRRSSRTSAS